MLTHRGSAPLLLACAALLAACEDDPSGIDRPRFTVDIEPLPDTVAVGDTVTPVVRVRDGSGTVVDIRALLSTSDTSVLKVLADGRLAARRAGVALLRASDETRTGSDSLEVVVRQLPRSLALVLRADTLLVNDTMSVAAARYVDGLGAEFGSAAGVRYFSSDTGVLRVDSLTGRLTPWRSGTAQVIARVPGAEGRATVRAVYWRALTPVAGLTQVTSEGGGTVCGRTDAGLVYCQGSSAMLGGSSVQVSPPRAVSLPAGTIEAEGGAGVACAAVDSSAWCWGDSYYAQFIGGALAPARVPLPDSIGTIADLAVSRYQDACVVAAAGALRCWGNYVRPADAEGPLGIRRIVGDAPFTSVSLGGSHGCAVTTASTLWCWGTRFHDYDPNHELRRVTLNTAAERITTPVPAKSVVAMDYNTCMLGTDGSVWCWGQNANGEFGLGAAAGFGSAYLPPTRVALPAPMTWLGGRHGTMCAIDAAGEMWCWGNVGQVARPPFRFEAGTRFRGATFPFTGMCALATDGRVLCSRRVA